ncbi:hypothetical protein EVAR_4858_1 [Eumeta japonica]|uniref:Uncharacterized protein n=1 Tax=Eumeta variegata TaxID=151549 RepID=A0A4C1T012_EUMVA|nr:hypothetical protein EVAR_4858_1 [Eumeta japonica]
MYCVELQLTWLAPRWGCGTKIGRLDRRYHILTDDRRDVTVSDLTDYARPYRSSRVESVKNVRESWRQTVNGPSKHPPASLLMRNAEKGLGNVITGTNAERQRLAGRAPFSWRVTAGRLANAGPYCVGKYTHFGLASEFGTRMPTNL